MMAEIPWDLPSSWIEDFSLLFVVEFVGNGRQKRYGGHGIPDTLHDIRCLSYITQTLPTTEFMTQFFVSRFNEGSSLLETNLTEPATQATDHNKLNLNLQQTQRRSWRITS